MNGNYIDCINDFSVTSGSILNFQMYFRSIFWWRRVFFVDIECGHYQWKTFGTLITPGDATNKIVRHIQKTSEKTDKNIMNGGE